MKQISGMGRKPRFNDVQEADIAARYDGKKANRDALASEYGVAGVTILKAAKRAGYVPSKKSRIWTQDQDDYIEKSGGKLSFAAMSDHLGVPRVAVRQRAGELAGLDARGNSGFSINALVEKTKVDGIYWHRLIGLRWLKSKKFNRGSIVAHRIAPAGLERLLRAHPEVLNYTKNPGMLSELGIHGLPAPPQLKLVTCHSSSIATRVVETKPAGLRSRKAGVLTPREENRTFSVVSCGAMGGVDFWVPMYVIPACPRCGVRASRFSEKGIYTNDKPDDTAIKSAMAQKMGLSWKDGHFLGLDGNTMTLDEVHLYVFDLTIKNKREWLRKKQLIDEILQYETGKGNFVEQ